MSELWIDINSDLGESEESLANGADFELMRYITSANVACGGHAGDERTMRETVRMAKELGVAVGAHPGYPDRANFGRVEMALPAAAIEEIELAWGPLMASLGYELARGGTADQISGNTAMEAAALQAAHAGPKRG